MNTYSIRRLGLLAVLILFLIAASPQTPRSHPSNPQTPAPFQDEQLIPRSLAFQSLAPSAPVPGATLGWMIETVETGFVGNGSSLALDPSGQAHISYYDFLNADLKYARRTPSGWLIETVDSAGFVGAFNSLALDSTGNPHISYCSCTTENCSTCNDLKYAYFDGVSWHIQLADPSADNVGGYTSLVLLADKPHISYYDYTNHKLKYVYKDAGGAPHWEVIDNSANDVGRYTSLAIGFGYRHIAYYDQTAQHLKYAFYDGSNWSSQNLDESTYTGAYASLDLCRSLSPGGARIAYLSGNELKYAHKWIYGTWSFTAYNQDSPGGISLKVDPSCQVRISYYNLYNGDLKYFYWDVYDNYTEIIDDIGDSWPYVSSLALDAAGRPHISYYDDHIASSTFGLRFAYKTPLTYLPLLIR